MQHCPLKSSPTPQTKRRSADLTALSNADTLVDGAAAGPAGLHLLHHRHALYYPTKHHCKPGEISQFMSATLPRDQQVQTPLRSAGILTPSGRFRKVQKSMLLMACLERQKFLGVTILAHACCLATSVCSDAADVLVCAGACSKPMQELVAEMQTEDQ